MEYAHSFYVPSEFCPDPLQVSYHSTPSRLPGDASSFGSYLPSVNALHEDVPQFLTPRQRSSNAYPYPVSCHDYSPTRSRFPNLHSSFTPTPRISPFDATFEVIHSAPLNDHPPQNISAVGPQRHSRSSRRRSDDLRPHHGNGHGHGHTAISPPSGTGPTNHVLVPQGRFFEPACASSLLYRHPSITFQLAEFPEPGVKVDALIEGWTPQLVGHEEHVLKNIPERELRIQIIWPGYNILPFEKRIKTLSGTLPRHVLVVKLAHIVLDFAKNVKQKKAVIKDGHEKWMISEKPMKYAIHASDIFITKLYHCGGSHWQMELWAPRDVSST